MGLDILTPKGQISLDQEKRMIKKLDSIWNGWGVSFIETNKDKDAGCDGFIVKMNTIVGAYESKCRELTEEELRDFGTWLITADKIKQGRILSKILKVGFLGFLYLVPEDKIFMWKITDSAGEYLFDFRIEESETQKTVNGGTIIRQNAYLPVEFSEQLK